MKACALAGMLVLALDDVSAAAAPNPDPLAIAAAAATAQAPPSVRLSDEALRETVRAALAQEPPPTRKPDGAMLRADPYLEFSRQFSEAQKPSCLGPARSSTSRTAPSSADGTLAWPGCWHCRSGARRWCAASASDGGVIAGADPAYPTRACAWNRG